MDSVDYNGRTGYWQDMWDRARHMLYRDTTSSDHQSIWQGRPYEVPRTVQLTWRTGRGPGSMQSFAYTSIEQIKQSLRIKINELHSLGYEVWDTARLRLDAHTNEELCKYMMDNTWGTMLSLNADRSRLTRFNGVRIETI